MWPCIWMSMLWTQLVLDSLHVFLDGVQNDDILHEVLLLIAMHWHWFELLHFYCILSSAHLQFIWGEKRTNFIILSNLTVNNYVLLASSNCNIYLASSLKFQTYSLKIQNGLYGRNVMLSNIDVHQNVICCCDVLFCLTGMHPTTRLHGGPCRGMRVGAGVWLSYTV